MMRLPDWPDRLANFLADSRHEPFEWGRHDCCLFGANGVRAIAEIDVAAPFRGRYRTAIGAARVLRRFAGGGVAEAAREIGRRLDCPEIDPRLAQRGDVALVTGVPGDALGGALGLCIGGRFAVAALAGGWGAVPLGQVAAAWAVR